MSRKRDPDPIASDGLPAREGGHYAALKHGWLEEYLRWALNATKSKTGRNFVDLFAGPGRSIIKGTNEETDAGALIAAKSRGPGATGVGFTACHMVNLDDGHHHALTQRIASVPDEMLTVPRHRIRHYPGDANQLCASVLKQIPLLDYVFVFADPENAAQWPWSTIQAIRAQGHTSVDLYMLFPWGMDIRRKLGKRADEALDAFFGTPRWREIEARSPTDSEAHQRARAFELRQLYLEQLRTLWTYSFPAVRVNLRGDQNLYWMLFATSNPVGNSIAAGVSEAMDRRRAQTDLFAK